jgi:hypothetical protein
MLCLAGKTNAEEKGSSNNNKEKTKPFKKQKMD